MLLQWLTSSIDDNHYLRMMLTRHDLSVIGSQYCTCLIAAGVIKEVNRKDSQWLFKVSEPGIGGYAAFLHLSLLFSFTPFKLACIYKCSSAFRVIFLVVDGCFFFLQIPVHGLNVILLEFRNRFFSQ